MDIVGVLFILGCAFLAVFWKTRLSEQQKPVCVDQAVEKSFVGQAKDDESVVLVEHAKKTHLATKSESKLYFALCRALGEKYVVHSQVSLFALVKPVDFRHNSKSWAKRMDFVVTDRATKVLAVVELDDATHNRPKAKRRDAYVNHALKTHHPLIRIETQRFYDPEDMAALLEVKAGIKNRFKSKATS